VAHAQINRKLSLESRPLLAKGFETATFMPEILRATSVEDTCAPVAIKSSTAYDVITGQPKIYYHRKIAKLCVFVTTNNHLITNI
jgi:hypothetical protein